MSSRARLGRPPASSSAETRARILGVARRKFATLGFEATSNRALADEAGLTTGAIYHYFDSKLDIYTAVHNEAQDLVYGRFAEVIVGLDSFVERLEAVLEESNRLDREDPTLAQFLGSSRIDAARNPDLADALRGPERARRKFFTDLVAHGVETGELAPEDAEEMSAVIRTITIGLVGAVSGNQKAHRAAVDGIKALLHGRLLQAPGS